VKREQGFTLLEVLVAMTVLAVGSALVLSLISGSLGNIRKVRLHTRAAEHAQTVMELALLDDSIESATTMRGDFEDGTQWSVAVSEVEMPLISTVMPGIQATDVPMKVLSYDVEIMEPQSTTVDFRLQTLKLVGVQATGQAARIPR
jgi:prepilin-type N-terminal cleavage/methylation domain-containing protein